MVKVYLDEILWIESMKNYVKIHGVDNTIVTYRRISDLEKTLPHNLFLRVHKSFIVAVQKVSSYNLQSIKIDDHRIPIGKSYKAKVIASLKQ